MRLPKAIHLIKPSRLPAAWLVLAAGCLWGAMLPARAADAVFPDSLPYPHVSPDGIVHVMPGEEVASATARLHQQLARFGNPAVPVSEYLHAGERLEYMAYVGPLRAGAISFAITTGLRPADADRTVHARLHVEPNDWMRSSFNRFFNFSAEIRSAIDTRTGRSLLFTREEVVDGRLALAQRIKPDYGLVNDAGLPVPAALFSEEKADRRNRLVVNRRDPYAIPPAVQDALSAFYYARSLPLERIGDEARFVLAGEKRLEHVALAVRGEDIIDLGPLGRYQCWLVEPRIDTPGAPADGGAQLARGQGAARLWIEKNTKIALKAEIDINAKNLPANLLTVVAILTKIENNPALRPYRLD